MPKKSAKRAMKAKAPKSAFGGKIRGKSREGQSVGLDYFSNMAARMGYGTPSLAEDTQYEMVRLSNNYWLMLTLYRNHWIARKVVDLPAEDMCKFWAKVNCQVPPDEIQRFDRVIEATGTPGKIEQAIKWSRLYGGAGCLICVKGHENYLNEPLDLDDVNPGSFRGLIPFDRWVGIQPSGKISNDMSRPLDWGLPESYTVTAEQDAQAFEVHSSRILRFCGPEVPTPEFQAQVYWGISILEVIFEELRKRDNASWSMLQILFRANILAQKNPDLAKLLSGLGISQQALISFNARMQAQNELLSNQSMLILGEDGELQHTQFTFSGLAEVMTAFELGIAGASDIPFSKLFGRSVTGLGQTNDSDEQMYYDRIGHDQSSRLKPQLSKLYPVIAMSVWGEVPDDLDMTFPSARVLSDKDKGDLADKCSAPILASYNAGVTSAQTTLKELRELSDRTGVFTNITDEDIDAAPKDVILPGLGEGGEGGEGGEAGQGGKRPDPGKFAKPNPKRELREESGGAMDAAIKKRVTWHGMEVSIENPAGSIRKGTGPDGEPWQVKMRDDYGYLLNTKGVDGDHLDVFMGPDPRAESVYVVHTMKAPDFQVLDEDKCFLNFPSMEEAKLAFFVNYDRPEHFGSVEELSIGEFIDKALHTKKNPGLLTAAIDRLEKLFARTRTMAVDRDPYNGHVGEQ